VVIALIFLVRLWNHEPPTDAARPLFKTSAYLIAVAAELLGMYTAALLLPRFGAQQQVYSAAGCIVGLHFIGLWLATRSPRFLHVTAGMCLVSLFSMIMPFTWRTIGLRYLLLGAGNAIVLWVAASGTD
jgi:predicted DNA repair protein MutK